MVQDLGKRAQKKRRKRWRENTQKYRERLALEEKSQTFVKENSPPESPADPGEGHAFPPEECSTGKQLSQRARGRKKVIRDRALAYARLIIMENKLKVAQKQAAKYRKRLQRLNKTELVGVSPSPRTKLRKLLRGRKVATDVRKKLEYGDCLEKQLKHNASLTTNEKQKQMFTSCVSGSILRKYRMLSKATSFCSLWRQSKSREKFGFYTRRQRNLLNRSDERKQVQAFLEDDATS